MIYSNAKAIALLRDLGNKLAIRLANGAGLNTVSQGFYTDANGAVWPYILLSNANSGTAEGNPVVYIEISNVDAVSKDIFGNELYAYAPHILQLGYELASGGAPIPARGDLIVCEDESIKTGCRFQVKELANGTAVTGAAVNAAAPVADLEDLYWPTKSV
jgi:hypothetical protein